MSELTSFEAMQMRFLLFRATKMPQMTSVPTSLTAKKTIKMKFFSKKIYCMQFVVKCTKHRKYAESEMALYAL